MSPLPSLHTLFFNLDNFEITDNTFPKLKKFVSKIQLQKSSYNSLFEKCSSTLEELEVNSNVFFGDSENKLENLKKCSNLKSFSVRADCQNFKILSPNLPSSLETLTWNIAILDDYNISFDCISNIPQVKTFNVTFPNFVQFDKEELIKKISLLGITNYNIKIK